MENPKKSKEEFKLEFHFNQEGLFINGNNRGLTEFAKEIRKAAKSEIGYHRHLTFSWKEMLERGNLIVNFEWIKSRPKPKKNTRGPFDVTIIKTESIGDNLWRTTKKKKLE